MIPYDDPTMRAIIAAQLFAMGAVRGYYSGSRGRGSAQPSSAPRVEPALLTAAIGVIAVTHFGAIFAYVADPGLLRWSAFDVAPPIRWIAIWISCLGMAGEIWAAVALGASYSPLLRVAQERTVVTAGPYRWIRHPLYAFWVLVMAGWGIGAGNWFILISGVVLVFVLRVVRVPREEAMLLEGLGEPYGRYMMRTGRFLPRMRPSRAQ